MRVVVIALLTWLLGTVPTYADSFETLLQEIQTQTTQELEANQQREQEFLQTQANRLALLEQSREQLESLKLQAEEQNATIDANETAIVDLEDKLERKLGDLSELFGVIRQTSGELKANFESSMISVHYPERAEFLQQLAERQEVPEMRELGTMWLMMLQELDESRKVSKFSAPVVQENGTVQNQEVIRIGVYGAVSEGSFLNYSTDGNVFVKALSQPSIQYQSTANNFDQATGDFVKVMIDPTRGQLLTMLTQKPNLWERIQQGGIIGYIIIGISSVGLFMALIRYGYLTILLSRVKKQAQNFSELSPSNPLGRIALTYNEVRESSQEKKEIVLEEAILKEIPQVGRYNSLIKLLAAISPLLGLLGTVTGMIITFQSITLFGTSDPKLMAGGISTALVTTVLGLCAAIPLLFAYTFIAEKTKTIIDVLEHQSVGLIAKEYA